MTEKRRPNKVILMIVICTVLLLQFGLLFSFGATFIALLDKYGANRSRTAIVHSLFLGVGLIFGAVSGALIDRIGLFRISIVACCLGPCGFISSYFANSLEFLYCSIGLVAGTGVALANICCSTAIVRVFKGRQRSLCLSIAYSAPALASVIYTNLITWFLNLYGLNGTFLLIGGLYLHCWPLPVIIYFYRSLIEHHVHKPVYSIHKTQKTSNHKTDIQSDGIVNTAIEITDGDMSVTGPKANSGVAVIQSKYGTLNSIDITQDDSKFPVIKGFATKRDATKFAVVDTDRELALQSKHRSITTESAITQSTPQSYHQSDTLNRPHDCMGKFRSIITNPSYMFLVLGASFIMGTCNAYMALVFDIAAWKTFTRSETLIVFIPYSLCCTISRIAPGAIEQLKRVHPYIFPLTVIVTAALGQFLILYTRLFELFALGVCLIGLVSGGTLSSVIVLSMNIVTPEQQAVGSGILFTLMGVLSISCTPLFGTVRDVTESYELVSYLAIIFFSTGLVGFVISLILRRKAQKKLKATEIYDTLEITVEEAVE